MIENADGRILFSGDMLICRRRKEVKGKVETELAFRLREFQRLGTGPKSLFSPNTGGNF